MLHFLPGSVKYHTLHCRKTQIDDIFQNTPPGTAVQQLQSGGGQIAGVAQGDPYILAVRCRSVGKTGRRRIVVSLLQILLQVVPGVHQIDPASHMVEQLLHRPVLSAVPGGRGGGTEETGKGVGRPVQ